MNHTKVLRFLLPHMHDHTLPLCLESAFCNSVPCRSWSQVLRDDVALNETPQESIRMAATLTAQCRAQWFPFVVWWPQTALDHPEWLSGSPKTLLIPWMSHCSVVPGQGLSHPPFPDLWASPDLQWEPNKQRGHRHGHMHSDLILPFLRPIKARSLDGNNQKHEALASLRNLFFHETWWSVSKIHMKELKVQSRLKDLPYSIPKWP